MHNNKLVEETRPAMYRAMKYWGKKPHNIWGNLIEQYTNKGDIVLDPFAGSSLTFFESVRLGRKPITMDINPLSNFIVRVYSQEWEKQTACDILANIVDCIRKLDIYKGNYLCKCSSCGKETDIYNYRHIGSQISAFSYKCKHCNETLTDRVSSQSFSENLGFWKPEFDMTKLDSVSTKTIENFGGKNITNIWTDRNLEILSAIFEEINALEEPYKMIFVFAFLQTLHLTTKMCALRSEKANRPLSTSWGRPAYMSLNKHMEQNPTIQLERAFYGNNGLFNALKSKEMYIGQYTYSNKIDNLCCTDGVSVVGDSKAIDCNNMVDLIITDPPYGNLIQYGELSLVWTTWLVKAYPEYKIGLEKEIIVKSDNEYETYKNSMQQVMDKCYHALKQDGTFILTFNSGNTSDWEAITSVVKNSGFKITDYYLQNNMRTSESNVRAKNGTAVSDYYLKLNKTNKCYANKLLEELSVEL